MNTTSFRSAPSRNLRRARSHFPKNAAASRASAPSFRANFAAADDLFLAHQRAEALNVGLFVAVTLAACVALIVG